MSHDARQRALLQCVGTAIYKAREQGGLTQRELSDRTGRRISRAVVANLESGRQRIALDQLYDLARALQVAPTDLLPDPAMLPTPAIGGGDTSPGDPKADDFVAGLGRSRPTWIPHRDDE